MKQQILSVIFGAVLTGVLANTALAGASGDQAVAHFNAIAEAEVNAITGGYADNAVLNWVGGPLDGVYVGKAEIAAVWQKFTAAQGKLKVEVSDLREDANPKGSTVSANVTFTGKNPVPVYYVLTYRGDRLVNEVWQINPKLAGY